jgi:hypothetical protein
MPRVLVAAVWLLALSSAARSDKPPNPTDVVRVTLFDQARPDNRLLRPRVIASSAHSTPVALSCCTVCSVGKACGNTCISRDKTCHVGPRCA